MTLRDMITNFTIQGNVRLSLWKDGEEVSVRYIDYADDLGTEKLPPKWKDKEVTYMFAGVDGFLHIELSSDEEV